MPLRIAFGARRPVHPFSIGGAEVSIRLLLDALAEMGETCLLCGELEEDPRTSEGPWTNLLSEGEFVLEEESWPQRVCWRCRSGVTVCVSGLAGYKHFIERELERFDPSVLLTQLDGALEALLWAQNHDVSRMFCVRDVANPYNWMPFLTPWIDRDRLLVAANSKFIHDHLHQAWNIKSRILYPPVQREPHLASEKAIDERLVLFVNPAPSKGSLLVQEVATLLPDFRFCIVDGWCPKEDVPVNWPSNAQLIRRQPMLADLFKKATAVIVPSQEPEAFCRVAAESQGCGTPVLASAHSGLLEAAGEGAILVTDYRNPRAWAHAIRALHEDPAAYRALALRGWQHSAQFEPGEQARRFLSYVQHAEAA
jgi:glycosyltransferase involved in cell wall biosynthesis